MDVEDLVCSTVLPSSFVIFEMAAPEPLKMNFVADV